MLTSQLTTHESNLLFTQPLRISSMIISSMYTRIINKFFPCDIKKKIFFILPLLKTSLKKNLDNLSFCRESSCILCFFQNELDQLLHSHLYISYYQFELHHLCLDLSTGPGPSEGSSSTSTSSQFFVCSFSIHPDSSKGGINTHFNELFLFYALDKPCYLKNMSQPFFHNH